MLEAKILETKHILCSVNSFLEKSYRLWDNVEKYGRGKQDTNVNIARRMRFAYWIYKATDTHSEYVTIYFFPPATIVNANAPRY
jgi:hypothetical protein